MMKAVRRLLALLVAACFFLPLCQCSVKPFPAEAPSSAAHAPSPEQAAGFVPAESLRAGRFDRDVAIFLLLFWGPLLTEVARAFARSDRARLAIDMLQASLCSLVIGWFLLIVHTFFRTLPSGVLLLASAGALLLCALASLAGHWQSTPRGERESTT